MFFKLKYIFCFCIVHTSQALFEPRSYISLMCRIGNYQKDKCKTQWFDPNDQPNGYTR